MNIVPDGSMIVRFCSPVNGKKSQVRRIRQPDCEGDGADNGFCLARAWYESIARQRDAANQLNGLMAEDLGNDIIRHGLICFND